MAAAAAAEAAVTMTVDVSEATLESGFIKSSTSSLLTLSTRNVASTVVAGKTRAWPAIIARTVAGKASFFKVGGAESEAVDEIEAEEEFEGDENEEADERRTDRPTSPISTESTGEKNVVVVVVVVVVVNFLT